MVPELLTCWVCPRVWAAHLYFFRRTYLVPLWAGVLLKRPAGTLKKAEEVGLWVTESGGEGSLHILIHEAQKWSFCWRRKPHRLMQPLGLAR